MSAAQTQTVYDSEIDGQLTPRHAPAEKGPKTHALVIGVGYYHHLPGGTGTTLKEFFDFQQLTSPPISALKFAHWLLERFDSRAAPLGSLELLLSPPSDFILPGGKIRQPREATMGLIRAAFDRWYERCDSSPENVAIFYFCGHGLMRENLALLAEDFGARPLTPFQTAVDLNATWLGMARCKAQTQCYFVDSCRQADWSMGKNLDDPALTLIDPQFGIKSNRDAPRFMATGPAKSAYGMTGDLTTFTRVLLESVERGARRKNGRWVVTSYRLSEALSDAMRALTQQTGQEQYGYLEGSSKGNVLYELSSAPEVDVSLCCRPEAATGHALLEMCAAVAPHEPKYSRGKPQSAPWALRAAAGVYLARAKFAKAGFNDGQVDVWVDPPGPIEERVPVT